MVIERLGLRQTQRWLDEMLATFASLDEFERRYADMSQETYAWFQGMFHLRLAEVCSSRGLEFLADLRSADIIAGAKYGTSAELLVRLEVVAAGFQRWAQLVEGSR